VSTAWALPTTAAAAAALFALQKCALQAGVPIEASARLAQHTVEEAKRYSTNCTYEMSDITAAALKLVSTASSPCAHRLLCSSARNKLSPRRNSCAVLLC
jgi:hypothetical protein